MAGSRPVENHRESADGNDELVALREEVASLRDHVRLLVDAIDAVREELSQLTRNALPRPEPLPPTPVLQQTAADSCADDFGGTDCADSTDRAFSARPRLFPRQDGPPMKITLEHGPFFTFLLRADSGETRLVQHDTDFPLIARTYGWSGGDEETDEAIWEAYDFLGCRVGESVEDPGYF